MVCEHCVHCACRTPPADLESWLRETLDTELERSLVLRAAAAIPVPPVAALPCEAPDEVAFEAPAEVLPRTGLTKRPRLHPAGEENVAPPRYKTRAAHPKHSYDASSTLMEFWERNILWPYPSRAEMQGLMEDTGLKHTQLQHWFVNQRKRHWSTAFGKVIPMNKEAVEMYLEKKYGSLELAVASLLKL